MPLALVLLAALLLVGCASTASEPPPSVPLAEGTDRAFRHTVVTDVSPEAIWRLWTDPSTWPDWDTELKSASLDGPWVEGARGRLVPLSGPSSRFEVTAVEPRATTFSTRLPLGAIR
ncbi:MAG: SRPBCC family protein, partial [Bacteroidota bacterium]